MNKKIYHITLLLLISTNTLHHSLNAMGNPMASGGENGIRNLFAASALFFFIAGAELNRPQPSSPVTDTIDHKKNMRLARRLAVCRIKGINKLANVGIGVAIGLAAKTIQSPNNLDTKPKQPTPKNPNDFPDYNIAPIQKSNLRTGLMQRSK